MRKLLTLLLITISLTSACQVKTKVEYGLKSIFTPTINSYEYKLNGVSKEFSQWTTSSSNIYYTVGNVGIGINSPTQRLHVAGNAIFDVDLNGQFVISSTSQARELLRINNVDVYKTFEIDGANNGYKVGIGTASPTNKLDVVGTIGSTDLRISTGKIGIGTASPSTSMHILGATPKIRLEENVNGYWWTLTSFTGVGANYGGFKIGTSLKDNCLTIQNESGNVGINKEEASYPLDVDGTIRTTSYLMQQGIYAGIYVADASTAQSIANGTTYTKSTAFTTNGNASNCTADATNDKITITKTGKYMVIGSCSFASGTANVVWRSAAFLGGVEQSNIHWARKVGTSGDVGSAGFNGTINVTSVPVDLDVRFRHDNGAAVNITVQYSNFTVHYLGE